MYCDPKVDHTNYLIELYTNRDEKKNIKLMKSRRKIPVILQLNREPFKNRLGRLH